MRIVVVGAGIGGLTLALAAAKRYHDVVVLERSPVLAEVGAGVQLSPNATCLLFALGLEPALRAVAFTPEAAEVRDRRSGSLLLRTELGAAAERRWGAPYLQVHRADLQALLLRALEDEPRVRLRLGEAVSAVGQDGDSAWATLEHGETVGGELLVGCDGLRSTVRAALWGERPARYAGQSAWRGLAPVERLPEGLIATAATVWTGRGRHFVHYPVRRGALINVVGVVEDRTSAPESWREPGDRAQFAAHFAGWPEPVAELIAAVDEVWRYALHDRPPLPTWSRGPITLLGDAAHPAPPFLAQGAAMAIEDAESLARHVTADAPIAAALSAYEAERHARAARVQAWAIRNAKLFHLPNLLARGLFATVTIVDQIQPARGQGRLDWLYGYRPYRDGSFQRRTIRFTVD